MRWKQPRSKQMQVAIATAFSGQRVSQIQLDRYVTLVGNHGDFIAIDGDFEIIISPTETLKSTRYGLRQADALDQLLDQQVIDLQATSKGTLTVSFENGWRIAMDPNLKSESPSQVWMVKAPNGEVYVSSSGSIGSLGDGSNVQWDSYPDDYPYGSREAREFARERLLEALKWFPEHPVNPFFGDLTSHGYEVVERERVIPAGYLVAKSTDGGLRLIPDEGMDSVVPSPPKWWHR